MTSSRQVTAFRLGSTWQISGDDSDFSTPRVYVTTTPNTTSQKQQQQESVTLGKPEDRDDALLLWLPYIIFAVVLLGLIAMSFVRFHYKRGIQYRLRQVELDRKRNIADQEADGGGVKLLLSKSASSAVDRGYDFSAAELTATRFNADTTCLFNDNFDDDEDNAGNHVTQRHESTSSRCSGNYWGANGCWRRPKSSSNHVTSGANRPGSRRRQPVVFTFNANGSMVDVRCEEDSDNTFRLDSRNTSLDRGDTVTTSCSVIDLEASAAASADDELKVHRGFEQRSRRRRQLNGSESIGWTSNNRTDRDSAVLISTSPQQRLPKSSSSDQRRLSSDLQQRLRFSDGNHSADDHQVRLLDPSSLTSDRRPSVGRLSTNMTSSHDGSRQRLTASGYDSTLRPSSPYRRQSLYPSHVVGGHHQRRLQSSSPNRQRQQQPPQQLPGAVVPPSLYYVHRPPHKHLNVNQYRHTTSFGPIVNRRAIGSSDEDLRRDSVAAEALMLWQKKV